ncbi:MAG: rRNA maturation RNase YbeY [Pegethrix bostrychoides GSE-TBD4-15B]|jgi:probable rRNA maturation factor|uniref:Endoribonuclease YbeY n=1 Tax=Pegethrix bostrychoides GSE-TBD4-15B TaxID=2839662 RepID=A0A951U3I3_9CYAN|nr:rRNA maturation RNase YbeY [Pegethrix bostrychoides GSE-TBD4-15B]
MPPIQVEVIVQNYFAEQAAEQEATEREAAEPDTSAGIQSPAIELATWESWFERWLEALDPKLSPIQAYELSLRLTDDAEIQSLNAQYRQTDQPTDVLAFAALEVESALPAAAQLEMPLYLGDIVISVETAQVQAAQHGHELRQELAWLAAHALLHLLGWDHPDKASLLEMLQQQQALLETIGETVGETIGCSSSYYQDDYQDEKQNDKTDGASLSIHS